MALGIGEYASAIPITVARAVRMNRDGGPGAVHAIGASPPQADEHAGRVAASRAFDIANPEAAGAARARP